ncbi:MAG: helix-turn-helix transcriptional regulator [Spirochaetales bacterium]
MNFRENLKNEIAYRGLLIKELAAEVQIPKRTLDSYVDSRGVMPPADIAVKIAKALDTSVEYLVTGENSSNNAKDYTRQRDIRDIFNDLNVLQNGSLENAHVIIHALAEAERKKQSGLKTTH